MAVFILEVADVKDSFWSATTFLQTLAEEPPPRQQDLSPGAQNHWCVLLLTSTSAWFYLIEMYHFIIENASIFYFKHGKEIAICCLCIAVISLAS